MRIEQLRAFLTVTETGNFGEAAKQQGVNQSTISRQIQTLEESLGSPLFHRNNKAKLTIFGQQFLPRANKMCQEWNNAIKESKDLMSGKQPELSVAAIHSVCAYFLPPLLPKFCQEYPHIQFRLTALGSDRALKVLRDGLVDIAIVMNNRLLAASPEMIVETLYSEPIEILMAKDHPLASEPELSLLSLARYPHVVFKDGYGMQRLVRDWFKKQSLDLQIMMELNTLDAFRGVIRESNAIAMLPRSALVDAKQDPTLHVGFLEQDILEDPTLKDFLTREVIITTTSDRLHIPPIISFCQLVRQFPRSKYPWLT
ncbi:MAG: LysR family transcriptional regulator [Synechococcaceae cyanobacterium RL_1_2]|nr:LysR family transcriptional regulator [Synechococcaceae cyanobacterium RL_1_2]